MRPRENSDLCKGSANIASQRQTSQEGGNWSTPPAAPGLQAGQGVWARREGPGPLAGQV